LENSYSEKDKILIIEKFLQTMMWTEEDLSKYIDRNIDDINLWKNNDKYIPILLLNWMSKISSFLLENPPPKGYSMERHPQCFLNEIQDSTAVCSICTMCNLRII